MPVQWDLTVYVDGTAIHDSTHRTKESAFVHAVNAWKVAIRNVYVNRSPVPLEGKYAFILKRVT